MKIKIFLAILALALAGCVGEYRLADNQSRALSAEIPKSIGTSFSGLLQQTGTRVYISLPLRYPKEWSKEKLKKELMMHAYKYELGNVMYIEQDGKITLNATNADQEDYWLNHFLQTYGRNSKEGRIPALLLEPKIADDLVLDGSITANYILLSREGSDEIAIRDDYYVVLVKNDRILGYWSNSPERLFWHFTHGAGEVEYTKSKFGFL